MTTDNEIIARCEANGIDLARLDKCLGGRDNWGSMIHAFEYLTVCESVLLAMKTAAEHDDILATLLSDIPDAETKPT